MIPLAERCVASVHWGGYRTRYCSNRGRFEEEGKRYCGTHLPSRVQAAKKKRAAADTARWEGKQARHERRTRIDKAEDALVAGCLNYDRWQIPHNLSVLIDAVRKARA